MSEENKYWLVMSNMVRARKAMREMSSLDLGERFLFQIEHQEVEGWPQLLLTLVDSETPEAYFPSVRVVASLREKSAVIEVFGHELTNVEQIDLNHKLDEKKVSTTLKAVMKEYLDFVGTTVQEILSEDASPHDFSPTPSPDVVAEEDVKDSDSLDRDLFVEEEMDSTEFLETVSAEEEIEALPSLD